MIFNLLSTISTISANGLELSCPAEAGRPSLLYALPAGDSSSAENAAHRVSFSELLGIQQIQ
jgi:hypothetical protein